MQEIHLLWTKAKKDGCTTLIEDLQATNAGYCKKEKRHLQVQCGAVSGQIGWMGEIDHWVG